MKRKAHPHHHLPPHARHHAALNAKSKHAKHKREHAKPHRSSGGRMGGGSRHPGVAPVLAGPGYGYNGPQVVQPQAPPQQGVDINGIINAIGKNAKDANSTLKNLSDLGTTIAAIGGTVGAGFLGKYGIKNYYERKNRTDLLDRISHVRDDWRKIERELEAAQRRHVAMDTGSDNFQSVAQREEFQRNLEANLRSRIDAAKAEHSALLKQLNTPTGMHVDEPPAPVEDTEMADLAPNEVQMRALPTGDTGDVTWHGVQGEAPENMAIARRPGKEPIGLHASSAPEKQVAPARVQTIVGSVKSITPEGSSSGYRSLGTQTSFNPKDRAVQTSFPETRGTQTIGVPENRAVQTHEKVYSADDIRQLKKEHGERVAELTRTNHKKLQTQRAMLTGASTDEKAAILAEMERLKTAHAHEVEHLKAEHARTLAESRRALIEEGNRAGTEHAQKEVNRIAGPIIQERAQLQSYANDLRHYAQSKDLEVAGLKTEIGNYRDAFDLARKHVDARDQQWHAAFNKAQAEAEAYANQARMEGYVKELHMRSKLHEFMGRAYHMSHASYDAGYQAATAQYHGGSQNPVPHHGKRKASEIHERVERLGAANKAYASGYDRMQLEYAAPAHLSIGQAPAVEQPHYSAQVPRNEGPIVEEPEGAIVPREGGEIVPHEIPRPSFI
jgi:hypothetical protein